MILGRHHPHIPVHQNVMIVMHIPTVRRVEMKEANHPTEVNTNKNIFLSDIYQQSTGSDVERLKIK